MPGIRDPGDQILIAAGPMPRVHHSETQSFSPDNSIEISGAPGIRDPGAQILFRGPQTWFSGIELFRGENIVNGVCAKLFSTSEFAPLVLKLALEVHYGQLWGCF